MNVADIMTKKPIILGEKATVLDAVKRMRNVSCGVNDAHLSEHRQ